jgi:hypothetical protein
MVRDDGTSGGWRMCFDKPWICLDNGGCIFDNFGARNTDVRTRSLENERAPNEKELGKSDRG